MADIDELSKEVVRLELWQKRVNGEYVSAQIKYEDLAREKSEVEHSLWQAKKKLSRALRPTWFEWLMA
jgi:predicted  nucleic acid-binding Zn-ribbon protein